MSAVLQNFCGLSTVCPLKILRSTVCLLSSQMVYITVKNGLHYALHKFQKRIAFIALRFT